MYDKIKIRRRIWKKINYPLELLEQVELIAGKDSELYRACKRGKDIGTYVFGWGNEFTFSNNEILDARDEEDFAKLRKQAKINRAKNKVFELYLDSYVQQDDEVKRGVEALEPYFKADLES